MNMYTALVVIFAVLALVSSAIGIASKEWKWLAAPLACSMLILIFVLIPRIG